MKKSVLIASLAALFISPQIKAQFTVDAELLPRGEVTHSLKKLASPNEKAVFTIAQRTRLNTGYKSKFVDIYVSLQDVHAWGSDGQLGSVASGNATATWLHQAYGVAHAAKWLDIKLGRQEIDLDDARIFGNVGWALQARSHDAAILQFKPMEKMNVDFGVAYNPTKITSPAGNYKTLQYLWWHGEFGKVKASVLFLNNGRQVTNTLGADSLMFISSSTMDTSFVQYSQDAVYFTQTVGFRAGYAAEKFNVFGAVYYQMGNNGGNTIVATDSVAAFTITKKKTSALLARLDISGNLGPVTLSGGYEYQSGNSQISPDANDQAFSPFYGTNHKFNGHMDYFYVGNHFGSVGLHDAFLGVKYNHKKGFWVGVDGHYFAAANDVKDKVLGTAMSSTLGGELDFSVGYKVSPELIFSLGYSQMIGTSTMETIRGGDKGEISNWGYIQVVFKPKIFDSENFMRKLEEKKEG
ncbi:MAG: hypothetical protein KBF73_00070 [Flavobacteriales bacterium]|nr:hypothetical protein [Flavobacteriales bacterium]